jgi:thiol-disulfide isomerase/thioredoxin
MALQNKKSETAGLTQKQRSWIYTGFFIAAVLMLFVFNNFDYLIGKDEPNGPYPPTYTPQTQDKAVPAPGFSLQTPDGKTVKLSDYKGKVVIIDFWATWCPPCRKGIPDLVSLKNEYGKKGFEIIGISVDRETKDEVVPFMKNQKINYPVVFGNTTVYNQYGGISSIPTSVIIDKKGNIVATHVGLMPKSVYEDYLKKLL